MGVEIRQIKPWVIEQVKTRIAGRASARQIANAIKLVEGGKAQYVDRTTIRVASQSHAGKWYFITQGEHWCDCLWNEAHPDLVCTHRIAALLLYCCLHEVPMSTLMEESDKALDEVGA